MLAALGELTGKAMTAQGGDAITGVQSKTLRYSLVTEKKRLDYSRGVQRIAKSRAGRVEYPGPK